jgi:hypothetical protein
MLQLSVEQMRASSGQQNANFGIRSEAASGVGIQRLKAQGEVATFHFPDNLARALKYEAKVIIDLIPKLYDTRRVVRILGMDGKESAAVLDPEMAEPHAELDETADSEVKEAFNPSVGRYDVAIDTGPSYQTQRQEAADALTSLTQSNPQIMQVAGDIVMRSYDFPMAEELAQRLAKTLPPGLQEHEGQPEVPPQVQQAMQQMGQQMDALTQELHASADKLQELQEGAEIKTQELSIKAYDAETKRIQVLGTAMGPEQVQALVMQTLQAALTTPAPGPQIYEDMQEMEQEEAQHPEMQEGMPQSAPPGMPPDMPPDPQAPEQNPPPAGFFTTDQSTQGQP